MTDSTNNDRSYYELEEEHLVRMIDRLREEFDKAAKPYLQRLTQLRSVRKPEIIWLTIEQARDLGLIDKSYVEAATEWIKE